MINFIIVTEVYRDAEERKILVPIDMIKYIQDANAEKDTYFAIRDKNEEGKGKYFFVKESIEEISEMIKFIVDGK